MEVSGFYAFLTVLDKLLGFVTHEPGRIIFPENASVSVTHCLRQAGRQAVRDSVSVLYFIQQSPLTELWESGFLRSGNLSEELTPRGCQPSFCSSFLQVSWCRSRKSVHSLAAASHSSSLNLFGMFNTGRLSDTFWFLHPRSLDKRFSEKEKIGNSGLNMS